MNITDIAAQACTKVGRVDAFTVTTANTFAAARHRQIYESFGWKSAQKLLNTSVVANQQSIAVTGVDNVISVRYNGRFLDPVLPQFIFDTRPELLDATGEPEFFNEWYDQSTGTRLIVMYPYPGIDQIAEGDAVVVWVLGKTPFDDLSTTLLVPYCSNALLAYVTADLLEFLHQTGRSQAKIEEANKLLEEAKAMDTPPVARPRQGKVLTVSGNSLTELTDSVCDILGQWAPETRLSVQERIKRNWQTVWEAALWPESTVVARVTATGNEQIILPHYFDRVISVRPDLNPSQELANREISLFFNIDPQIFERVGDPIAYTMLPSIGVAVLPPYNEKLFITLQGRGPGSILQPGPGEIIDVFVRGESYGAEVVETVHVETFPPDHGEPVVFGGPGFYITQLSYDTPITIAKPVTQWGTLSVFGVSSHRLLVTLNPMERERKFLRLWLLPNRATEFTSLDADAASQTFLVLGKRKMSPLVADEDTCQLRNVENIIINGAAADMLDKIGNAALAKTLRDKAGAAMQILLDGEVNQNAYNAIVTPYAEPNASGWGCCWDKGGF